LLLVQAARRNFEYRHQFRWIASGSSDGTVRLRDRDAPGQPAVAISTGNDGVVSFVAISANSRWIFAINSGGTIQMWDRDAGGQLVSTSGVGGPIRSVACAEDGIVVVRKKEMLTLNYPKQDSAEKPPK